MFYPRYYEACALYRKPLFVLSLDIRINSEFPKEVNYQNQQHISDFIKSSLWLVFISCKTYFEN